MTISSYSSMNMMPPVGNISKDIVTQNDKNSDSSLSIEELGMTKDQFSALDSDSDGLVTQNEIATAIDNKLSAYSSSGQMPSKDEFASLLSDMGLQMPEPPQKQSSKEGNDFATTIMSSYDKNGDSSLTTDEVSMLNSDEFSSLDTNKDGTISADELSSAFEQVASSQGSTPPPPPPPSGASSDNSSTSSSSQTYDSLDTNKDGIVSQEEKNAALGISSVDNSSIKDTIKMLLDTIKQNSNDSDTANLDLNNFKNIMKMLNSQTNNTDLNSYIKNLSSKSTSSNFSYA